MTDHLTDDRTCVSFLLEQAGIEYIEELLADTGYDSHKIYHSLEKQDIKPLIPPPIHAAITSEILPTVRDQTIDYIKKKAIGLGTIRITLVVGIK